MIRQWPHADRLPVDPNEALEIRWFEDGTRRILAVYDKRWRVTVWEVPLWPVESS